MAWAVEAYQRPSRRLSTSVTAAVEALWRWYPKSTESIVINTWNNGNDSCPKNPNNARILRHCKYNWFSGYLIHPLRRSGRTCLSSRNDKHFTLGLEVKIIPKDAPKIRLRIRQDSMGSWGSSGNIHLNLESTTGSSPLCLIQNLLILRVPWGLFVAKNRCGRGYPYK